MTTHPIPPIPHPHLNRRNSQMSQTILPPAVLAVTAGFAFAGQPVLTVEHASFFGGPNGDDIVLAMDIDDDGYIFIAGRTNSPEMPGRLNSMSGFTDAFVAKFSPDMTELLWSRYLGGTGIIADLEAASDVAAYGDGGCVVTGHTEIADFPVVNAAQPTIGGSWDAFVTRLDADGQIVFSTFLGGSGGEFGEDIGVSGLYGEVEVAPNGDILVAGDTRSDDFPTLNAFDDTPGTFWEDGFVTRYTPTGEMIWSTYIGDPVYRDQITGMAVADDGGAVIVGGAGPGWPGVPGSFMDGMLNSSGVVYATKLAADGQSLEYSIRIERIRDDGGRINFVATALGPDGSVWVGGDATTGDALVPPTALQPVQTLGSPLKDAVYYRFSADGTELLGATFLGHREAGDEGPTLAVDSQGRGLIVTWRQTSARTDLTRVDPLLQTADIFDERLTPVGRPRQFRVNTEDALVWTGQAPSGETSPGAFQPDTSTGGDAYTAVVRLGADITCDDADLSEPFGVLDLADVQAFIAAFTSGDLAADLAPPTGVLDLADVQGFLVSFTFDCP